MKLYVPPPSSPPSVWTADSLGTGFLFAVVMLLGIFAICVTP